MTTVMPTQSFGWYLKSVRKARKISLKQLSILSGVSQGAICDVEKGRRIPGREITNKLTKALSLDIAEVYARSGRLPDNVTNYMILHPNAGELLQRLVKYNFSDRSLAHIIIHLDKLYEMAKSRQEKQGKNKGVEQIVEKVDNTTPSVSSVINELQQDTDELEDENADNDEEDDFDNDNSDSEDDLN